MSLHLIPRIALVATLPTRRSDRYHDTIYSLAETHTNEEIFIALVAAATPYQQPKIKSVEAVFEEVRGAIRSIAQREGRSADAVSEELLRAQKRSGVLERNRMQIQEDTFGRRAKKQQFRQDGRTQVKIARDMVEEDAKKSKAIRDKMALQQILN